MLDKIASRDDTRAEQEDDPLCAAVAGRQRMTCAYHESSGSPPEWYRTFVWVCVLSDELLCVREWCVSAAPRVVGYTLAGAASALLSFL